MKKLLILALLISVSCIVHSEVDIDPQLKQQRCMKAKAKQSKHRAAMRDGYPASKSNYMNEKDRELAQKAYSLCH